MPARAPLATPTYRDADTGEEGAQLRAALPLGSILSSGDGVVQLRLEVESKTPTRWIVRTAAMDVPLQFEAGVGVAWVPLIEGLDWSGHVEVFSADAGSHAAKVTIEPVWNEARGLSLAGTVEVSPAPLTTRTWVDLDAEVLEHDALLVDWSQGKQALQPAADVTLTLLGSTEDGDARASRVFPGAVGTWALLNLGEFVGGRLDEVRVNGVRNGVELRLIRSEPRK